MQDVSVMYLSWIARIPGMGHHAHTHDYWHFNLRPSPQKGSAEGYALPAQATCFAPGVLNRGGLCNTPDLPGVNVMFVVHNKSLYRRLEALPIEHLSEEQLHVDTLMDIVWKVHDLNPDQDFIDFAFGYYLHLVLASYQNAGERAERPQSLAEKALSFIEENYMKQIRLEDVAEYIGRATYHTSHLVKEATGMTVVEHVREIRIKNACRKLAYSDTPIEEIISSCGFISASYFHRVFREKVGTTPARYRTSHMVRHTFYEGEESALDIPYTQTYFTYIPGAQKCIRWKTPREYSDQKIKEF